jgi:hypothetical protein
MSILLGTAFVAVLFVADPVPQPSSPISGLLSPPQACSSPEYRQFDFWLGEWTVTNSKGQFAGENRVAVIQNGCGIQENWSGADGGSGTSFNGYFDADRKWHQTWLDSRGGRLDLVGSLVGGKMILRGQVPVRGEPGQKVLHQISWERHHDGSVRQLWQSSPDGGASWTVVFDGTYVRKSAVGAAAR